MYLLLYHCSRVFCFYFVIFNRSLVEFTNHSNTCRNTTKVTSNRLYLYVYAVVKDKLEPPKGPIVTPELIQEATKSLRQYIRLHSLDNLRLDKLIQLLHTVHGKQREFTTELVAILQREALLQQVNLSKYNSDLIEEKGRLENKLRATDEKLEEIRMNSEKTEQLQANYNLNIKLLADCDTLAEKLQPELKKTKEFAAKLQAAFNDNT